MRTKIIGLVVSLVSMLGVTAGLGIINAVPAGASSCNLYGWVNPGGSGATYTSQSFSTWMYDASDHPIGYRQFCYVVGVITQPDGYTYRYAARVMDNVDAFGADPNYGHYPDDGGTVKLLSHVGGSTTGSNRAADTDSANFYFNESLGANTTYYSQWFDARTSGNPENNWSWDLEYTIHYNNGLGVWSTKTARTPSTFTVHG